MDESKLAWAGLIALAAAVVYNQDTSSEFAFSYDFPNYMSKWDVTGNTNKNIQFTRAELETLCVRLREIIAAGAYDGSWPLSDRQTKGAMRPKPAVEQVQSMAAIALASERCCGPAPALSLPHVWDLLRSTTS